MLIGTGLLCLFIALTAMFGFGGGTHDSHLPPRWLVFTGTLIVSLSLSTFVWVIIIVAHFVFKNW